MTTTHWKKLVNTNYIGSYSLEPGQDKTVTIKSVSKENVVGPDGRSEECIVAQLVNEKPFILNKTNCKMITKVHGSPYIEDWAGKKITLYAAKVKAFGDTVEALRIRPDKPTLPTLNQSHPKWDQARESYKAGNVTIDQIRSNYQLSINDEKLLTQ